MSLKSLLKHIMVGGNHDSGVSKADRKRAERRKRGNRSGCLNFESLEQRNLLAGIFFDSGTGEITIGGSNSNDSSVFSQVGSNYQATLTGFTTETFPGCRCHKGYLHRAWWKRCIQQHDRR